MADIRERGVLHGRLEARGVLSGKLTGRVPLRGNIDLPEIVELEPYVGPYSFEPSDQTQVVEIADKRALNNIIINPVPSNYGKITWDGSVLTVS